MSLDTEIFLERIGELLLTREMTLATKIQCQAALDEMERAAPSEFPPHYPLQAICGLLRSSVCVPETALTSMEVHMASCDLIANLSKVVNDLLLELDERDRGDEWREG
jgi:hypothetical protein